MEMDNLTERTITDDVIQNLYLIFFFTSQASNFIYTAVYLYTRCYIQISLLHKRGSKKADKSGSASFNLSLFHTPSELMAK